MMSPVRWKVGVAAPVLLPRLSTPASPCPTDARHARPSPFAAWEGNRYCKLDLHTPIDLDTIRKVDEKPSDPGATVLVLDIFYIAFTAAILPFFGFLGLVVIAALSTRIRFRSKQARGTPGQDLRFVIVIPAHNEESHVATTVQSCRTLDYYRAAYRIVVVADNCMDDTAGVARASGAEVIDRQDLERRSKGYALEFFFQNNAEIDSGLGGGFDAVVVVDADTIVRPDLLTGFAKAIEGGADWIQSYYSVSNPDASWRTRLLTYAFSLFNGVWLLGQDRLGMSVGFRGNGMCFTARGLERVPWKAYGLVEDQEFSWILRIAGERVRFLRETGVLGEMVSRGDSAVTQRQRWEDGRHSLVKRFLHPLLRSRTLSPLQKGLALLDLLFPPLTRLLALLLLALTIYPLAYFTRGGMDSLVAGLSWVHAVMIFTVALYAISPFLVLGLSWKYLPSLTAISYFAAWKVYTALRARTNAWVRTGREPVTHEHKA
jgi:cellulose synthase/poly-beta-1,6-N-acetylglucosamine synthase-like glycosyltransferase